MRTEREVVRTIYHKNVVGFFESIGLLERVRRGDILCSVCGEAITLDNFRAVLRKSEKLLFCCKREPCIQSFGSHFQENRD